MQVNVSRETQKPRFFLKRGVSRETPLKTVGLLFVEKNDEETVFLLYPEKLAPDNRRARCATVLTGPNRVV